MLRLAAILSLSTLAATCRIEPLLGVATLGIAVLVLGRRLGAERAAGAAALAGLALGLALTTAWTHRLGPDRGRAANTYTFYSFYAQSPLVLRAVAVLRDPSASTAEYGRYAQAMRLFGTFDENRGSPVRAMARHPVTAAVWLALKPIDFAVRVLHPDAMTPLALVALLLAVRRARREGLRASARRWGPLLLTFGAPLVLLLAAVDQVHHLLPVAPLLIVAALWGLEPLLDRARATRLQRLAWAGAIAGAIAVALLGHLDRASSPAVEEAARWLERRCAPGGCLVNALPMPIDALAWADLQAGARMPEKVKRSEAFVLKRYPPAYVDGVRWERRRALARERGWHGPVLYVRVTARSFVPFSDDFDPEHRLEGEPRLAGVPATATFDGGGDRVDVFDLGGEGAAAAR